MLDSGRVQTHCAIQLRSLQLLCQWHLPALHGKDYRPASIDLERWDEARLVGDHQGVGRNTDTTASQHLVLIHIHSSGLDIHEHEMSRPQNMAKQRVENGLTQDYTITVLQHQQNACQDLLWFLWVCLWSQVDRGGALWHPSEICLVEPSSYPPLGKQLVHATKLQIGWQSYLRVRPLWCLMCVYIVCTII